MSHQKLYFPPGETVDGFIGEIETPVGARVLVRLENHFGDVSNLLEHSTTDGGSTLVHMSGGNTILFENIPHIEFVGFVADTAIIFGIPA